MMLVLESDIENYLKIRVKKYKGLCIKFLPFCEEGLPDRIVILPGGHVVFVELKRPKGGRLAPLQEYQINKLTSRGCSVYVLKNYKEVDAMLEEQMGVTNGVQSASVSKICDK